MAAITQKTRQKFIERLSEHFGEAHSVFERYTSTALEMMDRAMTTSPKSPDSSCTPASYTDPAQQATLEALIAHKAKRAKAVTEITQPQIHRSTKSLQGQATRLSPISHFN
jgi:hypothetical protein